MVQVFDCKLVWIDLVAVLVFECKLVWIEVVAVLVVEPVVEMFDTLWTRKPKIIIKINKYK